MSRYPADAITLLDGRTISLGALAPEHVVPLQVANALSMLCRYGGRIQGFYSVAEHSVLVAHMMHCTGHSHYEQRHGLLHDASEAFTGDIHPALKNTIPGIKDLEHRVERVVHERFRLSTDARMWETVKVFDIEARHVEAAVLFPVRPSWVDMDIVRRWKDVAPIVMFSPDRAYAEMVARMKLLDALE